MVCSGLFTARTNGENQPWKPIVSIMRTNFFFLHFLARSFLPFQVFIQSSALPLPFPNIFTSKKTQSIPSMQKFNPFTVVKLPSLGGGEIKLLYTCLTDKGILLWWLGASTGLISAGNWACSHQSEKKKLYKYQISNKIRWNERYWDSETKLLRTSKG